METTEQRDIDYWPREPFWPFHERKQRWAILVCHRRAGKTVASINDLIGRALEKSPLKNRRYAAIYPLRNQAKDAVWKYLRDYTQPAWACEPYENELRVELVNGSSIRLYGADNPDALRGGYLDGVVLDEFPQMKGEVWGEVVRPMLADRQGWATFIGTPKGKNEFYKLYREALKDSAWFSLMLKASQSGILPVEEISAMQKELSPDEYQQEMECSFEAATKGAFYGEELGTMQAEGRIAPIEIVKDVRVHTAWDLGVSDSTAIWFIQCVGRERRLVDYYESSGVGLDHYVQVLHDKRMQHGWKYGEHFLPHDIQVREFSSGKSRLESLRALGIEATVVPEYNVLDGIEVVRRMLRRVWIDGDRCEQGLEALRQYRREWNNNLKDWQKNPLHDWASHGADALRYFATGYEDPPLKPIRRDRPPSGGTHWSA
jgi:hypothetical protein